MVRRANIIAVCTKLRNLPNCNMQLIPAILESELAAVAAKLAIVKADSRISRVHIDIIDGNLAPRLTVTPADLTTLDFGNLKIDWHLMTEDPLDYVWEILSLGQALPSQAIFGHIERASNPAAFLQASSEAGLEAGVALDLATEVAALEDFAWTFLDSVLLLAVPMGESGQEFSQQLWVKLTQLQQLCLSMGKMIKIYVDGGIGPGQWRRLAHLPHIAGAAMGSYYFATHGQPVVAKQ